MPCLYVNTRGEPHHRHSYSAGLDWSCPYKYYLKRVLGWKPKDNRGAFMFGRALEQAIEHFHDNMGKGGVEKFNELWLAHKDTVLTYTKLEKDWNNLNRIGTDMMKLYIIKQPNLPIPLGGSSVFQRTYSKEVFPGDENYGEILDEGKIDIVSYVDPSHPSLPVVAWKPEYGLLRPLIVDIKTAGVDLAEYPGMAAFDKQLRRYSWQSGIRDAALLWFAKKSLGYKKGSRVTLLVDVGVFKAGTEMFVASPEDDGAYLVGSSLEMTSMGAAQGRKEDGSLDTTKAAKERKQKWILENAHLVPSTDFTRQRLQFNAGFITEKSARDAGLEAGKQIVDIVNAWKTQDYPNSFGIRYPTDDRNDPYFRAFVLNDEAYKEENFKLASAEELENIFDEEPEQEDGEE